MSLRSVARKIRNATIERAVLYAERKMRLAPFLYRNSFVNDGAGSAYGITARDRRRLLEKFDDINAEITTATNSRIHIALANELLSLPPDMRGDVVECGCYKGASSAALSLVCAMVGRKLIVCDSFEGLPDDDAPVHIKPHDRIYGHYKRGMFSGSLDEVKASIAAHGDIKVCEFVRGYFNNSLRALDGPIVFAFLDVDLESSTRDALEYIWPLLVEGGVVFSDDASDLACVRPFFDEEWWNAKFGQPAPGFVGSGCGLSALLESNGYTRKMQRYDSSKFARVPWLHYPISEN